MVQNRAIESATNQSNTMTRTAPRTRMIQAAEFVRANPGCAILPVAEAVGPNGSRNYGYRTVHRAIRAGMIRATISNGRYSLTAA